MSSFRKFGLALCCTLIAAAMNQAPTAAQQPKQAPAKQAQSPKQATTPAQSQTQQDQPPAPKEIALTDKQVEGVLDSQKEMDAVAAKIPQPKGNQPPKPDPKIQSQFDDVAKKYGFASYTDYNDAVATISMVLGGFDPKTKTYVGPEAMLKQQISAVQADKKIPAKEKKAALDEMNAMLKSPPPPLQNKGNIDVIAKYYDRLAAVMQEGGE